MEQKHLQRNTTLHIKQYAQLSTDRTGDEWHTYCDWIESLPYFAEICLKS